MPLTDKEWKLLNLISLKSYSKQELISLLNIDDSSLLGLIELINNYCKAKVIKLTSNSVYLNEDFLFFADKDFQELEVNFNIEIINSLTSTNDLLTNYAKDGININNKVLIANEQTQGRGRLNKKWVSALGSNITFSLGLTYTQNIDKLIAITLVVALSVVNILRKYAIPVQIKWPNDIVVQHAKLGGILVNNITNDLHKSLVIGIGLNYNNNNLKIDNATYIKKYTDYSVKFILLEIIQEVYNNINIFKAQGFSVFRQIYLSYLRDINLEVNILQNNAIQVHGKLIGISEQGELMVQDKSNFIHLIVSGDLSLRLKDI